MSGRDLPRLPSEDHLSQPARGQGHGGIVAPTQQGPIATHEWRLDQLRRIKLPNGTATSRFQIDAGVAGAVLANAKTNPGVVMQDAIAIRFHIRFDTPPTAQATIQLHTAMTQGGLYALAISRTIPANTTDYDEAIALFFPRRVSRFQWRIPTPAGMGFVTFTTEFET